MPDPTLTPDLISKHGITPDEYTRIQKILGRDPNFTELGIFSVMWSEHCSYKNSRLELKKFPTTGPSVLVKAGDENAGVIDIGDQMAVAFKIESHNHPSAVEPFQGAATGVGGILRDIFTMGARPVANLNSLRFGPIHGDSEQAKTNRRLLSGVVGGIAHYGNCFGTPTIGGDVYFDSSYNGNPLVNAFSLGLLRHDQIRKGAATGIGNPVFYVGAKTGRDGLAGAAFASRDLTEESKEDRPAVQVGDPFMEKLLLEACLELYEHPEAVVGVQDMGAAGLTCSTCETASRGDSGIEIELDLVPQRETGMTPYEIMLSESQERMLIIVRKGHEATVKQIFEKWDLDAAEIGFVTDTGRCVVKHHGQTVADIPAHALAAEAPLYQREARVPADLAQRQHLDFLAEIPLPQDLQPLLPRLLFAPSIASKRWIYRQYDHMVQKNTVLLPGSDAAVIRIPTGQGRVKFLAMASDCNGRYCWLDPREGAKIATAECCRNLTMTGATPLGLTDNLNFGNPHNPEVFWSLRESVEGMSEACRAFQIPVTGGNVSLYNQSPSGAIDPTPVVAVVGLIDQEAHITPSHFRSAGDAILLVGGLGHEMGGSSYLFELHGLKKGLPPRLDLTREIQFQNAVRSLIHQGKVRSAHDLSDGGLAVALAECCFSTHLTGLGAKVSIHAPELRSDVLLFNETQGRALLSVAPADIDAALAHFRAQGVEAIQLGSVTADARLSLSHENTNLAWSIKDLQDMFESSLPSVMDT
ncbi:MAG: phosphoribosylformylglycinamidine synthase subunit PurL [Blastochloris sp.]|nr:phosphoribosylformylglycinamidine synthase subunit PurL [Blastochloris sp.]